MRFRKITAIVRRERLAAIESRLLELQVSGITVTPFKGFGEYANCFRGDLMVPRVRLEIFVAARHVEAITGAILDTACTACPGDGLIAVLPVERVVRIRTKREEDAAPEPTHTP